MWRDEGIKVWFFSRDRIPDDIVRGLPDPMGWGTPMASFVGGCDYGGKFGAMRMVGVARLALCHGRRAADGL